MLTRCIEVLRDFGREDWQLSATVCKMLCNYSARMTSTADMFGHTEAQELSNLLFEYLGMLAMLAFLICAVVEESELLFT